MNKSNLILLCVAVASMTLTLGCARQVVRGQDYGVVAISSNSNMWPFRMRDKAEKIMLEHFPEGYVIEHEEEVVVGETVQVDSETTTNSLETKGPFSIEAGTTRTSATTSPDTEWRIHYRRR